MVQGNVFSISGGNFNGSLWTVHTIFLPPATLETRSAIQWWPLDPAAAILQRGRLDDPTGTLFYAFPLEPVQCDVLNVAIEKCMGRRRLQVD
jgi:hypothetical protein